MLRISMPDIEPSFDIRGRVAWCSKTESRYEVGVEFVELEKIFKARMVEQICYIEHYRKEVLLNEGRELTSKEAASEWIRKYASDFPSLEEIQ